MRRHIRFQRLSIVAGVAAVVAATFVLGSASVAAGRIRPGNETTKLKTVTVAAGLTAGRTVSCPTGKRVVAGGAYWHRTGQNGDPTLRGRIESTAPTLDGRGWYASGVNDSNEPLDFTIAVQCLPEHSFPAYTVRTREVTVDSMRSGNADIKCPAGQRVVMGGGVWHRTGEEPAADFRARISGSAPDSDGNGWSAEGWSLEKHAVTLRVAAFCLPASAVVGYAVQLSSAPPGGNDEDYLECQAGKFVLGGGAFWVFWNYSPVIPATDSHASILSLTATGYGTATYSSGLQDDFRSTNLGFTEIEICVQA